MAEPASPLDVLRTAVAGDLPDASATNDEHRVLTNEVLAIAEHHRVQGLVRSALDAGVVTADAQVADDVRDNHLTALRSCLLVEETTVLALDAFDAEGIESRVLKGIAIAHLDHDDAAERIFGDADLLVRRSDYRRALGVLTAVGFERAEPAVRASWERRFGKAIVLRSASGVELDLHLSITGGYFGERIDHQRLWGKGSEVFALAGRSTQALDLEGRFIHACCHAVLGGNSALRAKRDVAQLVLVRDVDWRTAVAHAEFEGFDLVLAEAVRSTWNELRLHASHPAAEWATDHVAKPDQQQALDGYRAAAGTGWAPEGRSTIAALGRIDRVRFVAGLAAPSRRSLRFRSRTRREHLRLGARGIRGGP